MTSKETLNTIVDTSIRKLQKLRAASGENKLKIIASALNYKHCIQVVEAYRSRHLNADYVHSLADGQANAKVLKKLENHELDVIVQVRKLSEGFDHKYLAVAAVFSVFSNLSPFVQFVGRIMRVIQQDAPGHVVNNGVVVFHAGANIAQRWEDFQAYSEADREFFEQLLPLEGLDFRNAQELEIEPHPRGIGTGDQVQVRSQTDVRLEEIPLLHGDAEAMAALLLLQSKGYSAGQVTEAFEALQPVPVTKAHVRQAKRSSLNELEKNAAAKLLHERNVNPGGKTLDPKHQKTNLIYTLSVIGRLVNESVGKKSGQRSEFTRPELDKIEAEFDSIIAKAAEVLGGD